MELTYGAKYDAFRDEVRAFLQSHRDAVPQVYGKNAESIAWQQLLVERGFAARNVPKQYGGFGAEPDIIESRIIAEEFARMKIPPGVRGQGVTMLVPTLLEFGSEEQRQRWIPPTLRGDYFWCQGYSEPEAGSDLASLKTHAYVDGDDFVINGQKIWTSSAQFADMMFCLVRTEPDAPKHDGISYILLSMDTPGIEVRPLVQMTGQSGFNEVFFTDVRVPTTNVVAGRGQGWRVANGTLKYERSMLGNPDVTLARMQALVELMQRETLDGTPILHNPVFRDRLLRIQGRILALRANDLRILSNELNGDDETTLARMIVKLQGTELRHDLEALGIDALGDLGVLYDDSPLLRDDGQWQTDYMYFLGLIIGGGTSQVQKNIIAERGLGMPKEPKQPAPAAT